MTCSTCAHFDPRCKRCTRIGCGNPKRDASCAGCPLWRKKRDGMNV